MNGNYKEQTPTLLGDNAGPAGLELMKYVHLYGAPHKMNVIKNFLRFHLINRSSFGRR